MRRCVWPGGLIPRLGVPRANRKAASRATPLLARRANAGPLGRRADLY